MQISFRSTKVVAALAAATITLAMATSSLRSYATTGQTHVVEIRDSEFVSAQFSVRAGDTIKWINRDFVPHTVTAVDESWDSDHIDPGGTWQLVVTNNLFESYFCRFHPSMQADLRLIQ